MNHLLASFSDDFQSRLLDLLWRQWTALGVAGAVRPYSAQIMIDPEGLLWASLHWARSDPRLFDEIFDWLMDRGDWMNLQRLARIQQEWPGAESILAAVAEVLSRKSRHHKWKKLIKGDREKPPVPLFRKEGHFGPADAVFLKWGWQRAPVRHRQLGREPSMDRPVNLILKLRALFGRQLRAEVMAWLLSHPSGHPGIIARDTGHYPRSVQLTLNELERSGHIHSHRKGREKDFYLDHSQWRFLLGPTERKTDWPRWINWRIVFRFLGNAEKLLTDPNFQEASN